MENFSVHEVDKREKARIRKQKQRAKGSEKDDVTLGHTPSRVSRHTNTDTDTNTNALKENNKRKVSIPKNFHLSDSMIEYAKKNGVTKKKTLEKFTENFILQNQAKGYKYIDHEAAWKSWLRKAIDDGSIQKDPVTSKGDY